MYFNVSDFESTQKYVRCYLSAYPDKAGAHKLLAQSLEHLKQKEKALEEYKLSLKLESRQPDVVLKVCDLMVELKMKLNEGEARYWKERVEEVGEKHPSMFRFKEYLISMEDGSGDHSELEQLVKQEIDERPSDAAPRIRLLHIYLDAKRSAEALKYAVDVESSFLFRDNLQWYTCLVNVFKTINTSSFPDLDWKFYLNYLCILDRYVLLSFREHQGRHTVGNSDPLFELDQFLFQADKFSKEADEQLLQECIKHMRGQLCFHVASAILSAGKQSRIGWKEYTPLAFAVLSLAWGAHVSDPSSWRSRDKDFDLKFLKVWQKDAAFRCSQAGHVLHNMPQVQSRVSKLCKQGWREKVYEKLFSTIHSEKTSYFVQNGHFSDISTSAPTMNSLTTFDQMSQLHQPDSLHFFVWLGLRNIEVASKKQSFGRVYIPPYLIYQNFRCQVFEKLKLTSNNLKSYGVESLSRLDIDSFLFASVLCAATVQNDLRNRGLMMEDRPAVLPVDLTEPLCTPFQAKWWSSAYRLLTNTAGKDQGEIRMVVQRGLEVVRLIGNHGMDVRLVVQLAKHFSEKASLLTESGTKKDTQAIFDWAFMYWDHALTLLHKMEKNQVLRLPENLIFPYTGPDLTPGEVKILIEEGQFFTACRFMKDSKYEKAIDIFQQLKSPHASFYQGMIFKKLADEELENGGRTSEMESKEVIFLQKSRSAFYLTLDRLRAPHVDTNHPLNSDLAQYLQEVEDRLSHIIPDSYDTHEVNQSLDLGNISHTANASAYQFMPSLNVTNGFSHSNTSTPKTTNASRKYDNYQTEARPSPERLDAQLRRMTIANDSLMQTLIDQNKVLLESNKSIVDGLAKNKLAVEDLTKQLADLRREVGKLKISGPHLPRNSDLGNVYPSEEDYSEELDPAAPQLGALPTYPYANQTFDIRTGALVPPRPLHASQMVSQAFFSQSQMPMYQPSLASYYGLNYGDGQTSAIPGVLSSSLSSAVPAAVHGSMISGSPAVGAAISSTTPVAFAKGLPLVGSPIIAAPSSGSNAPAPSSIPRSQQIPVNVVITSSDVVPTQAPAQQPMLSVTIPPQHRHASVLAAQGKSLPVSTVVVCSAESKSVPHNFQISMPLQANIPTSESLEKSLSPLKPISIQALMTDVPTPVHSAIAVSSRKLDHKVSNISADSISGDDTVSEETDYNACPDFKPVIPLPEEIVVTTGEEDEISLFECRAKLYRFVDREWKERGVGIVKILKHKDTNKPRILMRREQVHKICANHFISPEMELAQQFGSDRAWTWLAQDFADQQVQVEKLCVRFKTVEDALAFKVAFDKGRELSKLCVSPNKAQVQHKDSSKVIADSKLKVSLKVDTPGKVQLGGFCFTSTPILEPVDTQKKDVATKEDKSVSPQKPSPFAGFSFSSTNKEDLSSTQQKPGFSFSSTSSTLFGKPAQPTVPSNSSQSAKVSSSSETVKKAAVFQPQSTTSLFGVPSVTAPSTKESTSSGDFMFGSSSNIVDFATIASQSKGKEVGRRDPNFKGFEGAGSMVFGKNAQKGKDTVNDKESTSLLHDQDLSTGKVTSPPNDAEETNERAGASEEYEPTAVFSPVVPLPSIVETCTGEEDEEVLYEERAKLLRFDTELREWKERGVGKMRVLRNKTTDKVRLVMRREQVLKVCCNHYLSKDTEFKPMITSDKALTWSAQDFAEGEMRTEVFALRFKSSELMLNFKQVVENVQQKLNSTPSPAKQPTEAPTKSLAELFKPKQGSWECSGCFTRIDASMTSCPCCQTVKPGTEISATETKDGTSGFTFGIKPKEKVEEESQATGFQFSNLTSGNVKQPPLNELFKPKAGSWECQECYTRNDGNTVNCVACTHPKPGTENDSKVSSSVFSFGEIKPNASFSFGIPNAKDNQPLENKQSFCFGTSSLPAKPDTTPTFVFGGSSEAPKPEVNKGFGLNTNSDTPKQGFTFGIPQSPPDESFGSPHKFDFKMKDKSPMKSPGCPSGADDSDEVAEEDSGDDIHFQPIIPLPDKVPVYTGEEDETVLYSQRAKLFRFADHDWKERGLGDLKILRHNTSHKVRLLMRRDQVLKLCLNHFISADLEIVKKDDKTWIWAAQDFSEGVMKAEQFACRFKSADIAAGFKDALEEAKAGLQPSPAQEHKNDSGKSVAVPTSAGTTPSAAMKNFTFKLPEETHSNKLDVVRRLFGSSGELPSNSDEIQVVYEAEVTEEEKVAALKLKLPQNFYLYKNAPPCTGCPGCEDDSDTEQTESKTEAIPSSSTASVSVSSSTSASEPSKEGGGGSLFSQSSFTFAPVATSIFGGSGNVQTQSSGTTFNFGKPLFGTISSSSQATNTATAVPSSASTIQKDTKSDELPFRISEGLSFAGIAASSTSNNAFQTDPNKSFSFVGAGSTIFGGSTETSSSRREHTEESSGDEDPGVENETHDPHYDPIISLPDMIEVRTGEEDEEKLFCQRAKLYRFDTSAKEWKERGVGEIKILKHPVNETFRLLLRRDQVHKVVLNQRIDTSIKLKPLSSSDKAWCWGGMNYAEEEPALEELAVRFRNSEHAQEFAAVLESCQAILNEAHPASVQTDSVGDEDEEGDSEDASYSDEYEEETLFEDRVALQIQTESAESTVFSGSGTLRVTQCSNEEGIESFWVKVVDDIEKPLCRIPILGESEVKREGCHCIWRGEDFSEDGDGIERTFTAEFCSEESAEGFQEIFYKLSIEVVDQTYTHVEGVDE